MSKQSFRRKSIFFALSIFATLLVSTPQSQANTLCSNGTVSKSSGRGTCSWNGGIAGGAPSKQKSGGFGYSDPFGSTSKSSRICTYIDRSKGRC